MADRQQILFGLTTRWMAAALCLAILGAQPARSEVCEPAWIAGVGNPGMAEPDHPDSLLTRALAVFDDGTGPALYAGGLFTEAGGVPATGIAKWDGTSWSAVGGGVTGFPRVYSLLAHDAVLYVGGSFTSAGGVSANAVAQWDGTVWSPLGGGLSGDPSGDPSGNDLTTIVHTLCMFDDGSGPALYAGGRFTHAEGQRVNYIAKWDGVRWTGVDNGTTYKINALAVYDDGSGPGLYAAGMYGEINGQAVNGVARWDGQAWTDLAGGMAFPYRWCRSLAVFDDGNGTSLFVGGQFVEAGVRAEGGAIDASRIARWNGSAWSALGDGLRAWVTSLVEFDDGGGPALYAGGKFTTTGQDTVNYLARWQPLTEQWLPLGAGTNYNIYALAVFDDGSGPDLYAGGWFTAAGGQVANSVARWDGCLVLPGNLDGDGDLGLDDWSRWPACWGGPGRSTGCARADADADGDVDLADAAAFLRAYAPR